MTPPLRHCRSSFVSRVVAVASLAVALGVPARGAEAGWVSLFDGRSLAGWKANEHAGSHQVADGAIVCVGSRSHLFYVGADGRAEFGDFEFEAEVLTRPGANSGIYFHTAWQDKDWPEAGYEVQINNTATGEGGYIENKKTGSLYGVRNVYKQLVPDDEWFTVRVRSVGPHVTIRINDLLVVDYVATEPSRARGTFALQCHDPGSKVMFRNLRVRPLAGEAEKPLDAGPWRIAPGLAELHENNFPVIDSHTHLKGGLTMTDVVRRQFETGINAGVALNCGIGFAVTNDAGIEQALKDLRHPLTFAAMQAEGREWMTLFTPQAVAKFDYVFTDAMTFFDAQDRRLRLWIKNEVHVGEPEGFMEMLVAKTVEILEREPIDILVNPTYLPEILAKDYDTLWTPERMERVIRAAAAKGVAIEINDRFRLPGEAFIRKAKAAGLKFTFGTNNGGRDDLGRLDYCVAMIKACRLEWSDFFVPGRAPSRVKQMLGGGGR